MKWELKRLPRAPAFWFAPRGLVASLLYPAGCLYGRWVASRMRKVGKRADVPVFCIGNFTLGGAGKTPLALAVANLLSRVGERPVFLTRGYGGCEKGPIKVDDLADIDRFGDEALLLARQAPTIVSTDRLAGAAAAIVAGASVIIMDDGFQNPSLAKDGVLVAVDGMSGIGNGLAFPAGPLRASLHEQLQYASGLVIIGTGEAGESIAETARTFGKEVFYARLAPDDSMACLNGRKVLAFAGIARPEKFFATLVELGAIPVLSEAFADHHAYTEKDARSLIQKARDANLLLVTTAKDKVRLRGGVEREKLASQALALPVHLAFNDEAALIRLISAMLEQARRL